MNRNPRGKPRETFYAQGMVPFVFDQVKTEFMHLRDYFRIVSDHLGSEATISNERIDTLISGASSEAESEYYYDINEEEIQKWHSSFPNIAHAAVLVTACSLLETALTDLCKRLEKAPSLWAIKAPVKLVEFKKDRGIRRAKKFLQQNLQIELHRHSDWSQIIDFYQVRNVIVHAGGDLHLFKKEDRKKAELALKRLQLTDSRYGRIQLPKSFLESLLQKMIAFWKSLLLAFRENAVVGPAYWP